MYYSLTFGGSKNTWTDWQLIPESPPMIAPPTPSTTIVDVPGRVTGPLDLSTRLFGRLSYQRISGTWSFLRDVTSKTDRMTLYESIRGWLHGRQTTVMLEEDPNHFFKGRFVVGAPSSGSYPLSISIGYDLEPVRYNTSDGKIDNTWLQGISDEAAQQETQDAIDANGQYF